MLRLLAFAILGFFVVQCGTQVPVKKEVTKTELIQGTEKAVYVDEKAERIKSVLIYTISKKENWDILKIKIRDEFKVPEFIMREDIAKKYIKETKQSTVAHNPIGELTGSLFAYGTIELWCLTEWMATVLPGKQKDIYLTKCKERYLGTKKKYTQEERINKAIRATGNYKNKYEDKFISKSAIKYRFIVNGNQSKEFDISSSSTDSSCKNKLLKEHNCGKQYHINMWDLVDNYNDLYGLEEINYPITIRVNFADQNKKIKLSENEIQKSLKYALKTYEDEKIAGEEKKIAVEKENEPMPAWNGTAFFVSSEGHLITNNHVIEQTSIKKFDARCDEIKLFLDNDPNGLTANIISQDRLNDLALLKVSKKTDNYAKFRNKGAKLGEEIIVMGYPFGKSISSKIKLNRGNVSSLSGLGDEFTRMQIDAALQPGNSGGPIYDDSGNVIGVAVAKANIFFFLEAFGTLPENMNFGIKSSVVKTFLESNGVKITLSNSAQKLSTESVADRGILQTAYLECLVGKKKLAKINKELKRLEKNN
tara:strand:+ start:424 stop:2028 length:1605 start_codon:yes stop_codon:yes gene_type:complete